MNIFKYDMGALGESFASWYISAVMNGEAVRETMRGEGMGALDLQVKFPVTYPAATHCQIAVQVKTGSSFAKWVQSKKRWRFDNVDRGHVEKWRHANQPVLLLWVKVEPEINVYWKFIGKCTSLTTITFPESHSLNPASKFEIERLLQMWRMDRRRVPKITVPTEATVSGIREIAKKSYQKVRGVFPSPLGLVTISNYAWRHLTRVTRPQSHIADSLTALPYVRQFLAIRPHQIQTSNCEVVHREGVTTVSRKVLAVYRDACFSDKGICVVYIRLDEKVVFPSDWAGKGLMRGHVQQELRLESIFRKPSANA